MKKLKHFTETQGMKKLSRGGTVVEQSPHHPEVEGLSPLTSVSTGERGNGTKENEKVGQQ